MGAPAPGLLPPSLLPPALRPPCESLVSGGWGLRSISTLRRSLTLTGVGPSSSSVAEEKERLREEVAVLKEAAAWLYERLEVAEGRGGDGAGAGGGGGCPYRAGVSLWGYKAPPARVVWGGRGTTCGAVAPAPRRPLLDLSFLLLFFVESVGVFGGWCGWWGGGRLVGSVRRVGRRGEGGRGGRRARWGCIF